MQSSFESQQGEYFRTAVGVRQGCLLSLILFTLLLDKTMQEILYDHHTSISVSRGHIYNLRFTDDIMGGSNGELQDFSNRLVDKATAFEMELNTKMSKIMTNGTSNIRADVKMNGQ